MQLLAVQRVTAEQEFHRQLQDRRLITAVAVAAGLEYQVAV
jgi:hypothetical protein